MSMQDMVKGVEKFRINYFCSHQEMFGRLAQGQAPQVLFITCSDSRIDPNLITQTQPGELFVIRNVGNIIPPFGTTNFTEAAAIEYAIQALGIKDIIICGHSHCGAMKGLLQLGSLAQEMPLVYEWLHHYAAATRRLVQDNYQEYEGEELLSLTVKENVLTQIENLETYPVIRSRLRSGQLFLHAWVYEIESGNVIAYNANLGQFVPIKDPLPVPDPIASARSGLSELMEF
ncbi:carbonic anhydrase [Chroococcidiopsis sp. CCNUC1]|uniref:carbonic anhydrase n=1 Tax=Chroococcidiopsis sp. CCNUC1 TaxID=2653189 RepID=UPI00201FC380|nr:carbonic anhydrase [Chroococcidiopsis sp. CCNUC1]URD48075.1 carbonic anhydrase [Chroococcidiopsis sp. CCNUC1]